MDDKSSRLRALDHTLNTAHNHDHGHDNHHDNSHGSRGHGHRGIHPVRDLDSYQAGWSVWE